MKYMFYAKERAWVESRRKLKYRNASSKNTVLPGARVCLFTSMVLGLPASTKMVSLVNGPPKRPSFSRRRVLSHVDGCISECVVETVIESELMEVKTILVDVGVSVGSPIV